MPLSDVFDALQVDLGGLYVNDFNQFGRTWQVNAQADIPFRMQPDDIRRLQVRNDQGHMVPLAAVAAVRDRRRAVRHQPLQHVSRRRRSTARPRPGMSSGQVIATVEQLADKQLSPSMAFEWTELMYLQIIAGSTTGFVFGGAVCWCSWCWPASTKAGRCRWR